ERAGGKGSVLRMGLRMIGHTIFEATTGSAAVAMVQTEPVDIVVMDDSLMDMSGTETLLRMRSIPTLERLPAVILWPPSQPDDIITQKRRALSQPAPAIEGVFNLRKPVSTHDVNLAIQRALLNTEKSEMKRT